jgi:PPOX class probable F420-dependent enzyme
VTTTLTDDGLQFVTDRHLATLSSMGKTGEIHTVPVGFTLHEGVVRIIASDGTQKVRNIERDGRVSVCQFEGIRWITFVGTARVSRDPDDVKLAVDLYAQRYRQPRVNPERIVIEVDVAKVLGSSGLRATPELSE